MILIRDLSVEKQDDGSKVQICCVDELEVQPRERVLVSGQNGSGKTTLLRVLGGLEKGFTGKVERDVPFAEIVFVHQTPFLFRGTVEFNGSYGLKNRKRHDQADEHSLHWRETVADWMSKFELTDVAKLNVNKLSGGEKRRVALARAMSLKPNVLLLDEPFADLDSDRREMVLAAIADLTETTVIIASPQPESGFPGFREYSMNANH